MDGHEDWKKAFYENDAKAAPGGSKKKLIVVLVVVVVGLGVAFFLLSSDAGPPKYDSNVQAILAATTYSSDGITSKDMLEDYNILVDETDAFSESIKNEFGYNWTDLVTSTKHDTNYELSALSYPI